MALRVLSIDGGGIRGILPARVLVELERIRQVPIAEQFDLIAGSSSGALIALALSLPGYGGEPRWRAEQLLDLLIARADGLFQPPSVPVRLLRLLGLRRGSAHRPMRSLLEELFGGTPFGRALTEVIVPAFDLGTAAPLILRSSEFAEHSKPLMTDVALASLVVPAHAPPVELELGTRVFYLAHGGLVANNPALLAYIAAIGQADPDEVQLLSLGVGARGKSQPPATEDSFRAVGGWGQSSLDAYIEASNEAEHQALDSLVAVLGKRERYWRIQIPLDEQRPEDAQDPGALAQLAEQLVESERAVLHVATGVAA
jgi:patatin-like phospholipase/acyl hydrolase